MHTDLIRFLQTELAIGSEAIALAQRPAQRTFGPLHLVLWQYGLISIEQLEQVLDWLEGQPAPL